MCMPLRSLWESPARSSGRSLVPQTQGRSWSNLSDEFKACIACKDLNKGRALHAKLVSSGEASNIYVTNRLINMYAKCGSVNDAKKVFDSMSSRNTASWNTLMLGYVENGEASYAMRMYQQMHEQREKNRWCSPDSRTYVAALKACSWLAEREQGEQIQGRIVKLKALENEYLLHSRAADYGFVTDIFVASSLVGTYVKCGSVADARRAFDRMPVRDVVSWTALMLGYAESGDGNEALKLFEQMKSSGVEANSRTFLAALKACISLARNTEGRVAALARGRAIHSELETQCETDIFVANTLVDMYAKCGSIAESRQVFDSMLTRTVVTWTAMMLGYVECGDGECALELFSRMDSAPNAFTFATALKACSCIAECEEGHVKIQSLERGMEIHSKLVGREELLEDLFVANTLVDMYAKCGSVFDARKSFDQMVKHDIVSWNALLLNCEEEVGLELHLAMQATGITPDSRSFVAILKACTSLAEGRSVHFEARRRGVAGDMFVASVLVEMYAKCGSIEEAQEVFESMEQRDVVSWTCLMMGYADSGEGATAFELFARMRSEECVPNVRTFLALLKACGSLVALDLTKAVHSVICCMGLTDHSILVNSLVDIYIRCGSVVEAEHVFHLLPTRDLVAWNTLLAGYSRQGDTEGVFHGFHGILGEGHRVNDVTFVCLLTACSHAGLVDKAQRVFRVMQLEYGILPCFDHYTCLIDALGRANRLQEAIKVVEGMPFGPSAVTWRTVLAACVKWKNLGVAKVAFQELVRVEERDVAGYSLMGNLYASLEMWEEHAKVARSSYVHLINSCRTLPKADRVHSQIPPCLLHEPFILKKLMEMYGRCGKPMKSRQMFDQLRTKDSYAYNLMLLIYTKNSSLTQASEFFDSIPNPNVVAWTTMLTAFAQAGHPLQAYSVFENMPSHNLVTWNAMLTAYAVNDHLEEAKKMFDSMPDRNLVTWNALEMAYAQTGHITNTRNVFESMPIHDLISWTAFLTVCSQQGHIEEASSAYEQMPERDVVACNALLDGYVRKGRLHDAKRLFDGVPHRNLISITTLLVGYSQSGNIHEARELFESMPERDTVSCTAMLAAYTQNGQLEEAQHMFNTMESSTLVSWNALLTAYVQNGLLGPSVSAFETMPEHDLVSYNAVLAAYAWYGYAEQAKYIFDNVLCYRDPVSWNMVLTGYAENGRVDQAWDLFCTMPERDVLSWTAMLVALVRNGRSDAAVDLFQTMKVVEQPDATCFGEVLLVCNHVGKLSFGRSSFISMGMDYGLEPSKHHYCCIVDLLCRSGYLEDAEDLVRNMPFAPNDVELTSLLSACRSCGDVERGARVAQAVIKMVPEKGGFYVSLASTVHSSLWKQVCDKKFC